MENLVKAAELMSEEWSKFNQLLDRMNEVDFGQEDFVFVLDDIEAFIQERDEIIELIRTAQDTFIQEKDKHSEEEINLFSAKGTPFNLVIAQIARIQEEIDVKEKEFKRKFAEKRDEVKSALKELQGDKKKIDFLNSTAQGEQDSGFNV